MMRSRLAVTLLTAGLLPAFLPLPSAAIEVAAYAPDPSLLPARQPVEVPLRVAEALSLEPLSTLAPAREGAVSDLAALVAWNAAGETPTRVGFARTLSHPLDLRYDAAQFAGRIGSRVGGGLLARRTNGNWVWGTSVEVAEAKGLRLELAEVNLPAGTRFWVFGLGGEARTFDLRLLRDDRTIVSPTIYSERVYLEVELPAGATLPGHGLSIRRVLEVAIEESGDAALAAPEADDCLVKGECVTASDFAGLPQARNGVFRTIFEDGGFLYTCSGALLNDTDASTLRPWLLTAHHCIPTQEIALTMDTRFFWRFTSCASSTSAYSFGPLGADLIATSEDSDVTLALAVDPSEVPAGVTYLGWSSVRPADGEILHRLSHPVLDPPVSVTQPQMYSRHQLDETPAIDCFDDGAPLSHFLYSMNLADTGISGGSSGSPVMRSDGIVVGQLLGSCGTPPSRDGCGTDETIIDGAFAASYPLLQPFLNPSSGGFCIRDADTACLLNGKFKVEVDWTTATSTGAAKVMSFNGERAESAESAFFWFFNATNFEMGVKMVDACVAPFNRYWVFFSGLTSQGFQVKVTRISDGLQKIYPPNPVNNIPTTTADTDAFTCP